MVGQMPSPPVCASLSPQGPQPHTARCTPGCGPKGRAVGRSPQLQRLGREGSKEAVAPGVGAGLRCGAVCRSWGVRGQGQLWAHSVLGVCGRAASWVTVCRVPGRFLILGLEDGETSEGGGGLGTPRRRGPARGSRQGWPRVKQAPRVPLGPQHSRGCQGSSGAMREAESGLGVRVWCPQVCT